MRTINPIFPTVILALLVVLGFQVSQTYRANRNVLSAVAAPQPEVTFTHSTFHDNLQSKTVLVRTSHGSGSGVVIKRNNRIFVWTAAHVVRDVQEVEVVQQFRFEGKKAGEQIFKAHVISRLPDTDAALLWVDSDPSRFHGADFGPNAGVGSKITLVGNIMGANFDNTVTEGIVSQVGVTPTDLNGWPWAIVDQTSAVSTHGSSGGPVFDEKGKVVGLIVGGPGISGISCYVPVRAMFVAAQKANVTWAMLGTECPPDHILLAAIEKPSRGLDAILKDIVDILGPETEPEKTPEPEKKAPGKKIKSPKSQ